MDQNFTPLFPAASTGGLSSKFLNVVPGSSIEGKPKFQPLPISSQGSQAQPLQGEAAKHACAPSPVITVKKDKDRITRICVQCTCGECIELDCEY